MVDGTPLGAVVLAKPLADINNAWKNVIGRVAVGTALGVFVAFLLAAFFSRRITRPLRRIGAAADRVAQGDLEVNVVGPNTGDDELGQLAKRFQGMVDRLREVDELERNFLMRVTHELRTPVTAISGHVQALNEGLVEPDELDASLAAVSEEVRRIGRLVDDLLDLTRLEAHQFRLVREEVGLESLLDQAATSFREKARVNDVQFDALTTGAPTVLSDGDRVLQVVTNLLDNAFRWTPRDGTVTLSYSAVNGNAAIHVSDTGPGIPKNDQDAVFHPFYSRRGEGGTGLGLSIGRELAHALGGRLTVESEVGHGTTFTLSLPTGPGPMRYRLCDDEEDVTGIAVELAIQAEPFADEVPYRLALHARGVQVAEVPVGTLTPAELFALGHALLDAAADGFGHFVPADEVFGIDLAPPGVPGMSTSEVAVTVWVDAGKARGGKPTRSGVAVQLVLEGPRLALVAEGVCDDAARVLSA